tara:strand:+ start:275 stop:493 length:219 start_codon:yes stop_codon:yes gene_type:complete
MSFYKQLDSESRKREKALIEAAAGMSAAAAGMLKAEKNGNTMMYEINRDILKKEVNEYFAGVGSNSIFAEII